MVFIVKQNQCITPKWPGRDAGSRSVAADKQGVVLDQRRAGRVAVVERGEDAAVGAGDEDDIAIGLDALHIADRG